MKVIEANPALRLVLLSVPYGLAKSGSVECQGMKVVADARDVTMYD